MRFGGRLPVGQDGGLDIGGNADYTNHVGNLNPIRYRGYYFDSETGLYFLNARYYDPTVCRFISRDDFSYLDPDTVNGINLFAYCLNNPVMNFDPSGHFAITLTALLIGMAVGAGIGLGVGIGGTIVADLEDGGLFNGDITLLSYIGNAVGGLIAGAGLGLCSVLGAGVGAALLSSSVLTVGTSVTLSGTTALGLATSAAFATGGLGYLARVSISDQEAFDSSDLLVESISNAASGFLSFAGGFLGGITGLKTPGLKVEFIDQVAYHIMNLVLGVYPLKAFISDTKRKVKQRW